MFILNFFKIKNPAMSATLPTHKNEVFL